ncbi:AAA family ATPase [Rhizobium sp. SL86]|uniref:AAA family ATPase n=1 Tax=Rhizobium sp. SL86 TaxID=2995148 RepID=UPI002274380F|nr:AAA family ATPase [Rhizobium sp. SL86]MCY1669304.1 AAA family ATPase [Rhizobium sp. SL86]
MTRTSSPMLWYGDFVDFGTFETVVNRQSPEKKIWFKFEIDELTTEQRPFFFDQFGDYRRMPSATSRLQGVKIECAIDRRGERTVISNINLKISDPKVEYSLTLEENNNFMRMEIDGQDIAPIISPMRVRISSGSLFPEISYWRPRDESTSTPWALQGGTSFIPHLTRALRRLIDNRTKDKTVAELATRLAHSGIPTSEKISALARTQGVTVAAAIRSIANYPNIGPYSAIYQIINLINCPSIFRAVYQYLERTFVSTLYIGPARVRSDRYYRYQDLAVSEIDPDGKNFPMFLNSLSKRQIDEFSSWVKHLFGYGVNVSRQTGHISINLTDGGMESNIVDVGYGVSQILPVLGQIWWAKNRPPNRSNPPPLSILAIEQPELHLHPAHQALLADALTSGIEGGSKQPGPQMRYVVETHSETLINRLGEFIASKRLLPSDVQVVLFEPRDASSLTSVRTVGFDDDGSLVDWPYGFFQPAVF